MFHKFNLRLGGMHLLMSFVGYFGDLMQCTGLQEIMENAFAVVPKTLTGKNEYSRYANGRRKTRYAETCIHRE